MIHIYNHAIKCHVLLTIRILNFHRYKNITLFLIFSHSLPDNLLPESSKAIPPHALGEDIEVPFISWVPRRVQFGTEAIAPPGALILTPRAPSALKNIKKIDILHCKDQEIGKNTLAIQVK